jgi:3-isopropylmalate dehydrogenase
MGLAPKLWKVRFRCCGPLKANTAAQAQHGSAPDIAGQNVANPTSMILSVAMLLEWLGKRHAQAQVLQASKTMAAAIDHTLADPQARTRDLGGSAGTDEFAKRVVRQLDES